ncbi:MAG TPA: V-type ATP synthase subunit K [Trueperaceae bacterium]|nr:V-type ATP synthase subunit K [Trueperaceae bacterium]
MNKAVRVLSTISLFTIFGAVAFAQSAGGPSVGAGLIALGAGLAIGLAAIAVGIAQAAIGSAGAGLLAERPEAFGQVLIYLVIPETLIIFGFVIAFFLNNQIGG